jgi:hypothetical protein
MRFQKLWMILSAVALLVGISAAPSQAQALDSTNSTVALTATLGESLTVSAAPAAVTFTLVPNGSAPGSAAVSITTTWALDPTRLGVSLYAYFSTADALTDGGTNTIPTTAVFGSVNGGLPADFTAATPFGNGMTVFSQALGAGTYSGTSGPDTIDLSIDTTGLGLPSGTYNGTLNIQAQAI